MNTGRKARRDVQIFSLSFLDAICCGFGAIIILFVLSKGGEPMLIEEIEQEMRGLLLRLEQQIHEVRGETQIVNRELDQAVQQLSEEEERLARLRGDLSRVEGEFAATRSRAEEETGEEAELAKALQTLTEEMRRLLASIPTRPDSPIGGIPIDSEYVIFVIDTSGSMQNYTWGLLNQKVGEILEIYPNLKGIQVMNDMGNYMFSQYQRRWIPDSPARRQAILRTLRGWRAFSNSSPVEGIEEAIRTFYSPDKKISIFVMGDEFTGASMQSVITTIDRLNRTGPGGERLVRIHCIGFPVLFIEELRHLRLNTTDRFATLMRIICERNGGAFIGLNEVRR